MYTPTSYPELYFFALKLRLQTADSSFGLVLSGITPLPESSVPAGCRGISSLVFGTNHPAKLLHQIYIWPGRMRHFWWLGKEVHHQLRSVEDQTFLVIIPSHIPTSIILLSDL